jgi:site-specific recombinase XerC
LTFLNHLFTMAITWGKVAENPVKRVKRFHEPHGYTRCLTPAQEDRLLDASNPHLKPVVIAAFHTGCRQGGLLSLRCADVNIPRRLVTVQAAYAKDRQPRSIPIDTILLQALEALPRLDDPQALVFGYHDIKHTFRRAADRVGLQGFRFHDLRHTFASRLVQHGVHLAVVKELLGHQNISMTMRYAHLNPAQSWAAVEVLTQPEGNEVQVSMGDAQAILHGVVQLGVVQLPDTGKQKRIQKWFTVQGTKRDAERKLTELLHHLHCGECVEPSNLTVGE